MNLAELKVGDVAKVIKLDITNKKTRRHLLDMGLTRGVVVKVKRVAPTKDPVNIELRGYELCVSRKDLKNIEVEKVYS